RGGRPLGDRTARARRSDDGAHGGDVAGRSAGGRVRQACDHSRRGSRSMSAVATGQEQVFNRELSWLAFNERVLEEARNDTNPLLQGGGFPTIFPSNLCEFFIR